MSYTPVELRHVRISRRPLGYSQAMVEQVLEEVAESFEATWRERGDLADKVEALEKDLAELRHREGLLTRTLVAAEQAAADVRDSAKRAAEAKLAEAENEARSITRSARAERDQLQAESRHVAAMLRAALSMVDESEAPDVPELASVPQPVVADPPLSLWRREDTREFEPIKLPPVVDPEIRDEELPAPPMLQRIGGGAARELDWGD